MQLVLYSDRPNIVRVFLQGFRFVTVHIRHTNTYVEHVKDTFDKSGQKYDLRFLSG